MTSQAASSQRLGGMTAPSLYCKVLFFHVTDKHVHVVDAHERHLTTAECSHRHHRHGHTTPQKITGSSPRLSIHEAKTLRQQRFNPSGAVS